MMTVSAVFPLAACAGGLLTAATLTSLAVVRACASFGHRLLVKSAS